MTKDILDKLTFVPFKYEEAPFWEGGSMHCTKETMAQVRAGAVLKLKTGGEPYLVGDCNELLGVCDDCRAFAYEDIAEIAYLWEEEPEPEGHGDTWEEKLRVELAKRGELAEEE